MVPSEPLIFMAKLRLTIKTIFSALFTHTRVCTAKSEKMAFAHTSYTQTEKSSKKCGQRTMGALLWKHDDTILLGFIVLYRAR